MQPARGNLCSKLVKNEELKYFLKSNTFLQIEKYQNFWRLFLSLLNLHIS